MNSDGKSDYEMAVTAKKLCVDMKKINEQRTNGKIDFCL